MSTDLLGFLSCFPCHSYSAAQHWSLHKRGERQRVRKEKSCTGQRKMGILSLVALEDVPRGPVGWQLGEGIKGNSKERILLRKRNHFSDDSHCNISKEGRKQEQESEQERPGNHCSGFALIHLLVSGPWQ